MNHINCIHHCMFPWWLSLCLSWLLCSLITVIDMPISLFYRQNRCVSIYFIVYVQIFDSLPLHCRGPPSPRQYFNSIMYQYTLWPLFIPAPSHTVPDSLIPSRRLRHCSSCSPSYLLPYTARPREAAAHWMARMTAEMRVLLPVAGRCCSEIIISVNANFLFSTGQNGSLYKIELYIYIYTRNSNILFNISIL
jgi:hypothetical protein